MVLCVGPEQGEPALCSRPVVMVVEDDVEMNELQRELLAAHGMETMAAYSGVEALEVFAQRQADAVLLDVMLPEMDGFETCKRLRTTERRTLPIVMVTALDNEECRREGLAAGADAYFAKPFDPDELIDTIRRLMNHAPPRA